VQAWAKAGPQRVVALGSEPRQVQELHNVGSLESWGVVAPALGVKHAAGPVRCQGRLDMTSPRSPFKIKLDTLW